VLPQPWQALLPQQVVGIGRANGPLRKRDAKMAGVVTANQGELFVKRQGKPFDFTGVRAAEDVLLRSELSASQVK
jgi:hypothetical protein